MKKYLGVILASILISAALTGCACKHEKWNDATCTEPKTCAECGETEGEPLGHDWKEADCKNPKTCKLCGETEGKKLEHQWSDATCTNPKTCKLCKQTDGEKLEHKWKDADCENPKTCSVCGETEGAPIGHEWEAANCEKPKTCLNCRKTEGTAKGHNYSEATCTEPKKCSVCGKTEGSANGHSWSPATLSSAKKCKLCGNTEGGKLDYKSLGTGQVKTQEGDPLNLRRDANINSEIISAIPNGTSVAIYDCGNSKWYYAVYNGKEGYASADYISTEQTPKFTLREYCDYMNSKFMEAKNSGAIEGYIPVLSVEKDSNGNEFLKYVMFEDNLMKNYVTDICSVILTYNSILESNGEVDTNNKELIRKYKSVREEWEKLNNEYCADTMKNLKNYGLKNGVAVYWIDPEYGEDKPVYISVNGNEYFDALDELLKSEGLTW